MRWLTIIFFWRKPKPVSYPHYLVDREGVVYPTYRVVVLRGKP